jgi:hypothetical protein
MKRLLTLAAVFGIWANAAQAQFTVFSDSPGPGRSGGRQVNREPTNAKSAWEQLPGPVLSCVDAALQGERSSLNDLIRKNVYPADPYYGRIIARCEQDLRPKAQDSSEPVWSPDWKTYSLEKRFAYFLETFWVDRRLSNANCNEVAIRGKSYFDRKACIVSRGFWFETGSPERCKLVVRERTPMMTEPAKAWDGKVIGKVMVGREVTFDLRTLDESLIRKNATSGFELYFEMTDPSSVVRRIALSNEPEKWIDVPPPPLASTTKLSGSDDETYDALTRARNAWASEVNRYEIDIPGYEISSFANSQDTNSEEGHQRLRDNRMRTFLLLSTSGHYGHVVRPLSQEASSLMTAEFIGTVKEILSQCQK